MAQSLPSRFDSQTTPREAFIQERLSHPDVDGRLVELAGAIYDSSATSANAIAKLTEVIQIQSTDTAGLRTVVVGLCDRIAGFEGALNRERLVELTGAIYDSSATQRTDTAGLRTDIVNLHNRIEGFEGLLNHLINEISKLFPGNHGQQAGRAQAP